MVGQAPMSHLCVPVVDQEHTPLMPTRPSRARRWIRGGKATGFWKGALFCVRLNVEPAAREQQPVAVGIDPGSKREGLVVVSASHTYANMQAEARMGVKEADARPRTIGGSSASRPLNWHHRQLHRFAPEKGGKRLTQSANVADCRPIKLLRWKMQLAPLDAWRSIMLQC